MSPRDRHSPRRAEGSPVRSASSSSDNSRFMAPPPTASRALAVSRPLGAGLGGPLRAGVVAKSADQRNPVRRAVRQLRRDHRTSGPPSLPIGPTPLLAAQHRRDYIM